MVGSGRDIRIHLALRPLLKDTCSILYTRFGLKDHLISTMGGHDSGTHQFTGLSKYFNAWTITGRRNCVLLTYASIATVVLFFKLKPKKQAAIAK